MKIGLPVQQLFFPGVNDFAVWCIDVLNSFVVLRLRLLMYLFWYQLTEGSFIS